MTMKTRVVLAHAHINYNYNNYTCIIFLVSAEAMLDKERKWEETLADDSVIERQAQPVSYTHLTLPTKRIV